jgi:hypothetical protein
MSQSKHPKTRTPSDADLKGDPGIGSSKGAWATRSASEATPPSRAT